MRFNGEDIDPEETPSGDETRRETGASDTQKPVDAHMRNTDDRKTDGSRNAEEDASANDGANGEDASANQDSGDDARVDGDASDEGDADDEDADESPRPFVTLPVGPDIGLSEVVAAAQEVDHAQAAWHPGMIHSQTAEVIAAAAPGASLATVLEQAAQQDLSHRDQAVRVELIAACERMMAHLSGLQAQFAQEFMDQRGNSLATATAIHDEISLRLATTSYAAGTIITRACTLADSPRLREALDGGEVSARKIDVIAAAVSGLDLGERTIIEDYGVELAPTHTPPQLKKALEAAVLATDPSRAKERHEKAVGERTVTFDPAPHGMSWLSMYLPAEDGLSIYNCLDSIAATHASDDPRGIDARRADALTEIFTKIMASGQLPDGTGLPTHHGQSAHIHLSITAPVLAGDEHTPALLHGYGPIGAAHARELARRAEGSAEPGRGDGTTARSEAACEPQPDALSSPAFFKPADERGTVPAPRATRKTGEAGTSAPCESQTASKTVPAPSSAGDRDDATPTPHPTGSGFRRPDPLNLAGTIGAPCLVAPGVLVSLAAHPGATWSERCDLGERLPADATTEELDAVYGPAKPWSDRRSRAEDLAIWNEILRQPPKGSRSPDESPHHGDEDEDHEDAEWNWMCRYLPHLDPMRSLLPPPRPPHLPDGTNADDLIGWIRQHPPGARARTAGGISGTIESELGLICTDAYAPSRRLRTRVIDRDQTCRFPTCRIPAWRCQLDHITPYDPDLPAWAQTVETNLHALCAHHHQIKTAGVVTVERDARTGATTWHTPTGHAYVGAPEHPDYTAIAHHLRDEHHITLCEPEPTTGLEGLTPLRAPVAVGTDGAVTGADAAAAAAGIEEPTSPGARSLAEIWAGDPPF